MPSKYTIGNSPIKRRIRNKNNAVSGFAQVEREIGRVQSVPSLVGRSRQLPNGTLHLPPKAQAGGGSTPWKVSITKDKDGVYTATINEGEIYEGLLDLTKMVFETDVEGDEEKTKGQGSVVVANDVVCILYTYRDGATPAKLELSVFPSGEDFAEWEYKDENEEDPPEIIASRYPLAKILDTGEIDAEENPILQTEQMASNNLALVSICKNGEGILSFTPF